MEDRLLVPSRSGVERPVAPIVPVVMPQELTAGHELGDNIMGVLRRAGASDEMMAQGIGIKREFESPRTAEGGRNLYFLNTHHFYEGLMQIPEIAENLGARKEVDWYFFNYEIDNLVQDGRITQKTADDLKKENASMFAGVNDWGAYIAYRDWANRVFSRYSSSFVFSGLSQSFMITLMTGASHTVRDEAEKVGQDRISEAIEDDEEEREGRKAGLR